MGVRWTIGRPAIEELDRRLGHRIRLQEVIVVMCVDWVVAERTIGFKVLHGTVDVLPRMSASAQTFQMLYKQTNPCKEHIESPSQPGLNIYPYQATRSFILCSDLYCEHTVR